ncbi:hypothetical protein L3X38_018424 [Prunus dulcis]|uniref:Uncharacterized protein n=1 Tax=Prunus dulcis TaxID=3755 RepID=A0AAD4WBQ5_PRUDU|nr:hypothetical protein L3X38_018424 [Prunus dulcis]
MHGVDESVPCSHADVPPTTASQNPTPSPLEPSTRKRKPCKKESDVWEHFEKYDLILDLKGVDETKKKEVEKRHMDKNTRTLAFDASKSNALVSRNFNKEDCLDACIRMVVQDELPFSFVEGEGFREFCSVACPQFNPPSRRTLGRRFLEMYTKMKEKLKVDLRSHRICLTTDTWTSVQNVNYMVLTAHFVDSNYKMDKRILNFCVIDSHKWESIGKLLENCLIDWGHKKILTITADNADANTKAIEYRVEARLASLLMESKEYSEALSVLSGLIKEVRRLVDKLLLVDIDLMRSTVRVSHRLPLVFFVVSERKRSIFFLLLSSHAKVLSVKMVSQQQTKDSVSKKLGIVAPQDKSSKEMKSSKKMKFASSSAETESQTTISDDSKTGRGMSTMPRVVKRKLQKVRPIVEYNKMGKGIGQAHIEMQSYIGVLARSRVPLVDKKWSQIPKDVKEQIWEAVDMAFVVGQGGKKSVLASAAKKWKDFKSTLTRHYILPYTNDKEKLSHPPETYKFIDKAQWDAFVASRLSQDFESVHSQHAQIREKLEYNHRLSRKGYAGLEDELEETMPGVEIDRSTLWKRARQDKHGNIPDPKVAEKAKLIDDLQKQVSEGKVRLEGSKDVLTMALGPEHPGRLRGVGAGISPRQYFN